MFRFLPAILASFFLLCGCTHSLHFAHVSDFSPNYIEYTKGQIIEVQSKQSVVLGFVTDTAYVEDAHKKLMAKCAGGNVQGIVTQYSTSHGFLSWTNQIDMKGLCYR